MPARKGSGIRSRGKSKKNGSGFSSAPKAKGGAVPFGGYCVGASQAPRPDTDTETVPLVAVTATALSSSVTLAVAEFASGEQPGSAVNEHW